MTERRYSEEEVAEILDRATEEGVRGLPAGQGAGSPGGEGLTLVQLQEIGAEVGIPADAIARGAAALQAHGAADTRVTRYGGMPLGLSRTVSLPRRLGEEEWARLVVLARETFDATGKLTEQGDLREWRNGNLHLVLEPEGDGSRVRIRTRREGWEALPTAAGFSVLASAGVLVAGLIQGDVASMYAGAAALLTMGAGAWGFGTVALRNWARAREGQFEAIAEEAARMAAEPKVLGEGEE